MYKTIRYYWRRFLKRISVKTEAVFGDGNITYHRINDLDRHSVDSPK